MASELLYAVVSIPASADLSAKQFYWMKLDTSGNLTPCGSGGKSIGMLQDKPSAAGQPGLVSGPGSITRAVAGGTVTAGDYIESDSTGKSIKAVTGGNILGQALNSAASGEIFRVLQGYMGTA